MSNTAENKLPDVWTTGHPGVTISLNHSDDVAAHRMILGPTRAGMGVGPIFPQVLDLADKPKR